MARPLRIEYPGAVYHLMSRGNQGQSVFRDDIHRKAFLDILVATVHRFNWLCYAYCLMDNHYHLVVETPDGNLSQGMRQLNGVYTQFVNRQTGQGGHLFQGRYKAVLVEKDSHLLEVIRYVLLNPVRAGAADDVAAWPWSSYRSTCGSEPSPAFATAAFLAMFSEDRDTALRLFREFLHDGMASEAPWRKARGQVLLGSEAFCAGLVASLTQKPGDSEVPRSQRLATRQSLTEIFTGCLKKDERDKKIAEAVTTYGYSQKEIADFLTLHYSSISRILAAIESRTPVDVLPTPSVDAVSAIQTPELVVKPPGEKRGKKTRATEKPKEKEDSSSINQLSLF